MLSTRKVSTNYNFLYYYFFCECKSTIYFYNSNIYGCFFLQDFDSYNNWNCYICKNKYLNNYDQQ